MVCEMAPQPTMVDDALNKLSSTMVNHGSTMVCEMAPQPTMVDHALIKLSLTMVNHGLWNGTSANHGWPCFDQAVFDHGQPWFGQAS